jgi:hypothetical protein
MASEPQDDQRAVTERDPIKAPASNRPSPQSGPPIFNDGPESLRSSHC